MFDTLILHQLNKLTECQVGDFPSPQAFQKQVYQSIYKGQLPVSNANPGVAYSPCDTTLLFPEQHATNY